MIRSELHNGILDICFDRPDKRNALSHAMYDRLAGLMDQVENDPSCSAVILHGAGGMFTAGADIQDFQSRRGHDDSPAVRFLRKLARIDVPVIAAVEGLAIGIGATMLLHADFVYASPQTRFRMPFVALGLCPEAGSSLLLEKVVGPRRAREWLLQCQPFDGQQALDAGFVTALSEPGRVLETARATAADLARLPMASVRAGKALLRRHGEAALTSALDAEVRAFADLLNTEDTQRIFKAFLEKTP